jgi:putative ABC transport system permease protein
MSDLDDHRGSSGLTALSEGLAIALDVMAANKIRSGLTILGVAVGVSVVVSMGALVSGLRESIMEGFSAAGPTNLIVLRMDFTQIQVSINGDRRAPWRGRPEISAEEAHRIRSLPTIRNATYDLNQFFINVEVDGLEMENILASAYEPGWAAYSPGDFVGGRDFSLAEMNQGRPVVVVTQELATELFGQLDPMGRQIKVTNVQRGSQEHFTVIGVYVPDDNIFSTAFKHWAVFPWTSANRRLSRSTWEAQILVVPEDSVTAQRAEDDIIATLRGMRGLRPRDENNFSVMASSQLLEIFDQLTAVFLLVILLLASTALLVGGVGVVGIMLISVTERTREIGVRKAVGATRREILWQFLVEASLLTASGAMAGLLIGWGMAKTVAAFTPLPASIPFWAVAAALGMAVVTGMLFGLLPAYRASRLEPVAALRFE